MWASEKIYTQLSHEIVFADLSPQRSGPRTYIMNCPSCGQREMFAYDNSRVATCNRKNHCGYQVGWFQYVRHKFDLSSRDTFKKLAEIAGITGEITLTKEQIAAVARSDIMDAAAKFRLRRRNTKTACLAPF